MVQEINIGEVLLRFFWGVIDFTKGLYGFFTYEIHLPSFMLTILRQIFPNFGDPGISIWLFLSTAGAGIALAIGIYYIFKGPV